MAERFKAPVLKTGLAKVNVGSNPSPSAKFLPRRREQLNTRGGAGVAERDRLLSDCRALNSTESSNLSLPARFFISCSRGDS